MPLPAKNPETFTFDSWILRRMQTGPNCVVLTMDRFGDSGLQNAPVEYQIVRLKADADEKAFIDSIDALALQFSDTKQGDVDGALELGVVSAAWLDEKNVVHGELTVYHGKIEWTVPDAYAEAAKNPTFRQFFEQFMLALHTFNQVKGIV